MVSQLTKEMVKSCHWCAHFRRFWPFAGYGWLRHRLHTAPGIWTGRSPTRAKTAPVLSAIFRLVPDSSCEGPELATLA